MTIPLPHNFISRRLLPVSLVCILLITLASARAVELRDYYITCDPAEFAEILANPFEDIYVDCVFEYNGLEWTDARIRLRGESSREYPKKSYKINFDADNRFPDDGRLRDKINLASCYMDRSFAREHICYDLYQRAGLPASRTSYVRFFVNGVYLGLYLDVEQVDEHFLDYTDLPDDASIYKADGAGSLLSTTENIMSVWQKETNTNTGFDDLIALREWIDRTPAAGFEQVLDEKFDPQMLARAIALNALLGNQSTYYHNYYLVHDVSGDGNWIYLPWDMDNSLYFWNSYREPPYYRSGHQSDFRTNPLISKSWISPGMREMILDEIEDLSETLLEDNYYTNYVAELHNLLYDAVAADTAKQFSTAEFVTDLAALPAIIEGRRRTVLEQIDNEPSPFLLKRSLRTEDGVLLHWYPAVGPDDDPVTYELWICDNVWFTGDVVTIPNLTNPWYFIDTPPEADQFYRVYARMPDGTTSPSISYYEWVVNELPIEPGRLVTEPVTANTVWSASENPYLLPVGLRVDDQASLTLEAGTVLRLGMEQRMDIRGSLQINGALNDSVIIEPMQEDRPWSSIYIADPDDAVRISYASIRDGGSMVSDTLESSMFHLFRGSFEFDHCTMTSSNRGSGAITAWNCTLDLHDLNVELPLEAFGGELNWPDALLTFGGTTIVRDSRFAKTPGARFGGDLLDFSGAVNTQVINCLIENAGDDGIDFDYAYNVVLTGNTVRYCGDNALSIGQADTMQVSNNVITDCANGVYAKEESELYLFNNVIAYCGGSGLRLDPADLPVTVFVRNCAFQGNGTHVDPDLESVIDIAYCAYSGGDQYPDPHSLVGDLKFVDVIRRDFRLRATSPLIDAGWGTGSPLTDIRDSLRVDILDVENTGGGDPDYVDIGAFEYVTSDPEPPPPPVPSAHRFVDNYPNPFNNTTTIRFNLLRAGPVELVIFDRLGRRVFSNTWSGLVEGPHEALWNGVSNDGTSLASGIYFLRLKQPAGFSYGKAVLVR